ncbi:hypothetical protein ACKGJI_05215 [Sulfurospirillum sp. 1307]|jgi:hypothetical protein
MDNIGTLDKIDNYLKNKKASELSLLFLIIFVVIGFLIYSYIFPITEKQLNRTVKTHKTVQSQLAQEKAYMLSVSNNGDKNFLVKKMSNELNQEKMSLENITYANAYVDTKLKNLSYLLFNDKNWAKFLDSITYLAQEYNINLKLLNNSFFEPNLQEIKQVLTIKLEFNGDFKNILKFINKLEESKLVVDIDQITLESTNTINGSLDIAVWGMKY